MKIKDNKIHSNVLVEKRDDIIDVTQAEAEGTNDGESDMAKVDINKEWGKNKKIGKKIGKKINKR